MTTFRADIIAFIKANAKKRPFDNQNACGKYQHLTAEDAGRHMTRQLPRENQKTSHRMEIYECRKCGYFHIGYNPFKGRYKKFLNHPAIGRSAIHPKH